MTPEQQLQARFTDTLNGPVNEYRSAAEIDFPAAAAAAQALQAPGVRPLALAAVAAIVQ